MSTASERYIDMYPRSNQLLEISEGNSLYIGCRSDVVLAAIEMFGQNFIAEILGKFSDDDVLQALERSLELYNAFDEATL